MQGRTAKGFLYLALVPILLIILVILSVRFSLLGLGNLLVLSLYTVAIYSILLLRGNSYRDPKVLEMVVIPNAPPNIEELLKKQTRRYEFIYIILIRILGKKKKLSQSDFVRLLKKQGIDYTQPAVEGYLSDLENEAIGIVRSEKGYKRMYCLTVIGQWCYRAVNVCFPKTFGYFVYRHYLGRRKLRPFPTVVDTL